MALVATVRSGKIMAATWAVACAAVLLFAFVQKGIRDTDIDVAILLTILCFPVSLALAAILTAIFALLLEVWGIEVPGGFGFNVSIWVLFVTAGYWQWRFIAPHLFQESKSAI